MSLRTNQSTKARPSLSHARLLRGLPDSDGPVIPFPRHRSLALLAADAVSVYAGLRNRTFNSAVRDHARWLQSIGVDRQTAVRELDAYVEALAELVAYVAFRERQKRRRNK